MRSNVSVAIPLYNKEREVARALRSVLSQTLPPREIIVVDDGSTDGSAAEVERVMRENAGAPIRLIRQPNAGVSAARNRALAEAVSPHVALLDADDRWEADYLQGMANLISSWPGCGIYASAFSIDDGRRIVPAATPRGEGPIDFFAESRRRYAVIPSAATLDRRLALSVGGFPAGMRLGEDQYLWTKLARTAPVCFTERPLAVYSKAASNRSAARYKSETTAFSLADLLEFEGVSGASDGAKIPARGAKTPASTPSNEYLARAALGKALTVSVRGGTAEAARTARAFAFTRAHRGALRKVMIVNTLPVLLRAPLLRLYNRAAWAFARRGL